MNWTEFFAMGGYAAYVWPAYALAFLVLIINVLSPLRQHKQLRRELRARQRAAQATSSASVSEP